MFAKQLKKYRKIRHLKQSELVEKINLVQTGKQAKNIATIPEVIDYLRHNLKPGDVLLLMGAGDVFRLAENLLK